MICAFGFGVGLGIVTGMPLGVVNVAIVDAATTARARFARGLGIGGGLADTVHATLAFLGVAQLVIARPEVARSMAIVAAILVIAFAVIGWRRRARPAATSSASDSLGRGIASGLALTLPNPGALAAWASVAAIYPQRHMGAIVAGVGVGIGSAAWFVTLAIVVGRVRRDHPALRWVPLVAMVGLVAFALVGVVRVLLA